MAYTVFESCAGGEYRHIGTAPTLDEALALIPGDVFFVEEDRPAYPDHFDAMTRRGQIYTIEPART